MGQQVRLKITASNGYQHSILTSNYWVDKESGVLSVIMDEQGGYRAHFNGYRSAIPELIQQKPDPTQDSHAAFAESVTGGPKFSPGGVIPSPSPDHDYVELYAGEGMVGVICRCGWKIAPDIAHTLLKVLTETEEVSSSTLHASYEWCRHRSNSIGEPYNSAILEVCARRAVSEDTKQELSKFIVAHSH